MAKQALIILAVVLVFGILLPVYRGFGFLDPRILAAYACLSLLFVAPASADSAAATPRALLARLAAIVAWGWGMTLLILGTAIVTLNVIYRRGSFITPPAPFLTALLVFSLSASIAIAELAAALARRFSGTAAKTTLRTAFLTILLGLAFGARVLPESVTLPIFDRFSTRRALTHLAWESAAVCAAIAALLLLVLSKTQPKGPFAKIPIAENPHEGGR
jgi:hypothetical protein